MRGGMNACSAVSQTVGCQHDCPKMELQQRTVLAQYRLRSRYNMYPKLKISETKSGILIPDSVRHKQTPTTKPRQQTQTRDTDERGERQQENTKTHQYIVPGCDRRHMIFFRAPSYRSDPMSCMGLASSVLLIMHPPPPSSQARCNKNSQTIGRRTKHYTHV